MERIAEVSRRTKETDIFARINLDGAGLSQIEMPVPFLGHMLTLLARHGFFNLDIKCLGDTEIDDHHLVEDLGITLGKALNQALGNREGIKRYGFACAPMDESLSLVSLDLSGRPYLVYGVKFPEGRIGSFDPSLLREFFKSFTDHSGTTLHISLLDGTNSHHIAESIFKALAQALRDGVTIDRRIAGVLSTKGSL